MLRIIFILSIAIQVALISGCGSSGSGGTQLLPDSNSLASETTGTGNNTSTNNPTNNGPHDSFSTAFSMVLDTKIYTDQKNPSYDNNYYSITSTGGAVDINFFHVSQNASGSDFEVHVYDSSQAQIAYFSAQNGVDNSMTVGTVSGQTYYIKVSPGYGNSYQYKINASSNSSNYEIEPNDDFASANLISSGYDYYGQNNGSDSDDYYKVVAGASALAVTLSHITTNASGSDFDVYVYNSSQTQIAYFSAQNGIDNNMTVGTVAGQTYYIKVYSGYDNSYLYKINATSNSSKFETEPNNDFASANLISSGYDYYGQNNGSDSNDYYKVVAGASALAVTLSHITTNASGSDFDVYVYNSSQTQVAYFSAQNGIGNNMTVGTVAGQTYYIKVYSGYGNSYQYKINATSNSSKYEIEPNNDFATANLINSGLDYYGQNNGSDSSDYYKVVAGGSSLNVSLTHLSPGATGSDFDVYIYNSTQTQIATINANNGVNGNSTVTVVSGQTYFVKVSSSYYSVSYQYKLRVN